MMLKDDDIYLIAIKRIAEKYVKDNVEVRVYENKDDDRYYKKYELRLIADECSAFYKLNNKYCNRKSYIMRVVSDLCISLAKLTNVVKSTNKERNDFFKANEEK